MRRIFPSPAAALLLLVAAAAFAGAPPGKAADTIVTHARVYTVDPARPWAEAIAIRGDRIVAVGSTEVIDEWRGPKTRVTDARERLVLPGIEDSHVHFAAAAAVMHRIDLTGTASVEEVRERIRTWRADHPADEWVRGFGWVYMAFPGGMPDRELLDQIVSDRPALMSCADGHTFWVNSRALAAAGIDRRTPDPPNGAIRHDAAGEPTGVLDEEALSLINRLIPQPSTETRLTWMREALRETARLGVVRMHSLAGDFEYLDLFDRLRRDGELTARFNIAPMIEPPMTEARWKSLREARKRYHDAWICVDGAKLMLDGVIDAHTGAMLEPYADLPGERGKLFWDPEAFTNLVVALDREGFQVSTHAIGDAAIRLALDAYEAAGIKNGPRDRRDKVEHVEAPAASDLPRFGRLRVVASFQPLQSNPDPSWIGSWIPHVGPEREARAMPWKSMLRTGAPLAFGSDWPVVTVNPWRGIQIAVTRQDFHGRPAGGWVPTERVTVAEAIRAYTLGGAWAMHRDQEEGSIEPGKLANLAILSQNIFEVDPHEIAETRVVLTMVGGRIVHDSRSDSSRPTRASSQ